MSPRPDHWPPPSYDFAIPQWLHDIGAGLVPVPCMLTELQLAWWESGRCHVMQRWPLRTAG